MSKEAFLAVVGGIIGALIFISLVEWLIPRIVKLLRLDRWWKSGKFAPPAMIEYRSIGGEILSGRPVGITGIHLVLSTDRGRQLVSAGSALDRDEFWQTWKYFGGESSGWVDEEGQPFDFTE